MNPVEKDNIKALAEAMKSAENSQDESEIGGQTAADLINALLSEPDKKKRNAMMKDFAARRKDVAKFISENADLINAEAEAALIGAAVGGTHTEKEVSTCTMRIRSMKRSNVRQRRSAEKFFGI